jgi:hypothetical protein
VPESIGTIGYFLVHAGDRLGLHPLARLKPPRAALAGLDPDTIAVAHGPPVIGGAAPALRQALIHARGDLPRSLLATFRALRKR